MAIEIIGHKLVVTLVDSSGENTAVKTYDLVAVDFDAAIISAGVIIPALIAITDAKMKGYSISQVFAETGVFSLPADAEVEEQALFIYQLDGNPFKVHTERIPAPKPAIFEAATGSGRNILDTADADVIAYRSLYQSPGNVATISDGETVDYLKRGTRAHRRSSKG